MSVMREKPAVAYLDRVELEVVEDRLRILAEELPKGVWRRRLLPHGADPTPLRSIRVKIASPDQQYYKPLVAAYGSAVAALNQLALVHHSGDLNAGDHLSKPVQH